MEVTKHVTIFTCHTFRQCLSSTLVKMSFCSLLMATVTECLNVVHYPHFSPPLTLEQVKDNYTIGYPWNMREMTDRKMFENIILKYFSFNTLCVAIDCCDVNILIPFPQLNVMSDFHMFIVISFTCILNTMHVFKLTIDHSQHMRPCLWSINCIGNMIEGHNFESCQETLIFFFSLTCNCNFINIVHQFQDHLIILFTVLC